MVTLVACLYMVAIKPKSDLKDESFVNVVPQDELILRARLLTEICNRKFWADSILQVRLGISFICF
jgi:hypothetical protein